MKRISVVGNVRVLAVIFDSVVQFGDNRYIESNSRVFALQRERPEFDVNEAPLENYPIFRRPIPQLSGRENLRMYRKNTVPTITVRSVTVKSVSTSAVMQAGSNSCIDLTTRIKHVRHFLTTPRTLGAAPTASAALPSARG